MSVRACLFDLDDTLIDRYGAYTNVYKDYYYQEEVIRNSLNLNEAIDYFWSLSPNNTAIPIESFKKIKARWPKVKGDEHDHYKFYFESTIKHMKILPGVIEFIDWINDSEYNWGVVTNGNSYQYKKVEITGLTDKIPFVLPSKIYAKDKPDSEIYLIAKKKLGLENIKNEEILFVGDNAYTDILGANRLGMKTAWIKMGRSYPEEMPTPDFQIEHVNELKNILKK